MAPIAYQKPLLSTQHVDVEGVEVLTDVVKLFETLELVRKEGFEKGVHKSGLQAGLRQEP